MLSLKLRALRVGAALLSLQLASEMPGITRDRFETVWHLRTLALVLILRISSAEIARDLIINFVNLMPSPQIRPTGLVFVQMIAARIVIEMDDGDDRVATVVPEVPVPEAVPAIPDDIIRLIMQFKHANFKKRLGAPSRAPAPQRRGPRVALLLVLYKKRFAAENWPRRMEMLARKEAERRKQQEKRAICQMKCACVWFIVACGVVLALFLCGC